MRTFEVLFALHLLQTRETALELKLQPLALVNVVQRYCRADHQLYMALVKLIHQSDKAAASLSSCAVITGTSNSITVWNSRESAI
ncbi:Uncharacterised protein [Klebsiella pneumoniae]|uniref:Uncharacterized protein n=1 Tax=Klebsiella pneumoniae TaxID=573 RepID=A0A377U0Q3_KLEPN|nr:Uncharacterised protein [Klebsiella pneumoniae]